MADAQLMEEQLQQSVLMSEQDAVGDDDVSMDNDAAHSSNGHIDVGAATEDGDEDEEMVDGEDSHDEDEEDDQGTSQSEDEDHSEDDDDAFGEEDAEGEDDDEAPVPQRRSQAAKGEQAEDDEDDEDEGVGAVKIKPGETDDEDDSDASSSASSANISEAESEDEVEWDETRVEEEEGDEESDNGDSNTCMFCKQDEEHDPAEDFEAFLACAGCGENAHQQCAREAGVPPGEDGPASWKCPECAGDGSEDSDGAPGRDEEAHGSVNGTNEASVSPSSRRATAPKLARDLLPSQKGSIKPDSHSVFNQLVLDEDPMDGSRVLRKRKTSSAEVEDGIMALRKRRRGSNDELSEDEANGREGSARPQSARSLRIKTPNAAVSVVKRTRTSAIVKMRVPVAELREILSRKPRRDRRDRKKKRSSRPSRNDASRSSVPLPLPPIATPFTSASYSQPFYSFYDKETDELKGKPYGGILTEAEADTSKTMPANDDRRRFDEAKQKAEEEWRQRLLKMQAEIEVPAKKTKKASGPASQIECIDFGGWEIDTWYAAPYPEEYSRNRVLYICEFCLKYMNSDYVAWRHKLKCPAKHPPGDEIYRHNSVSVFEVDGRKNPVYCQNLCLLAKLFLGSKTLYYDVEPFLFYVLCEYDDLGYHFVGYFSKEKRASSQNNVSCILTLPIHQRKGYGNLLIDFSYLLTRVEQKTGSPEKPLSDMGLVSYRNYWRLVMSRYLLEHAPEDDGPPVGLSIKKMSEETGMTPDDVVSALEGLRCLIRDPVTGIYSFRSDLEYCREFVAGWEAKNYVQLDSSALTWTPYVMGRGNATNFELGPALTAIAPREDDEPKTVVPSGETLVNGTKPAEPAGQESKVDPNTVLESTEPNDKSPDHDADPLKSNGVLVNGEAQTNGIDKEADKDTVADWMAPYANIPPTRFEVVPPIAGSRRADRSRPVVPRPPVVRTASTVPRPRPKRPSGSARRSSASKPKSSSKRKSGGTGRGPGRWPKGTKKSDYGNADSGPGFPPGWFAERERSAALAAEKDGKTDAKDTVQVQTPTVKEAPSSAASRRNGSAGGKGSPRSHSQSQSQSGKENNGVDEVMEDAEDADGEEE